MVDLQRLRFFNPFVAAAFVVAVLLCSGVGVPGNRNPFVSLCDINEATSLSGIIHSNPARTSSKNYYSLDLDLLSVSSNFFSRGNNLGASGRVRILVPSEFVESNYPGKLYSRHSSPVLYEAGEKICADGSWVSDAGCFVCSSVCSPGGSNSLSFSISHFRALCRLSFKRLMFGWGKAGGFVLALLSGSREYCDDNLQVNFRNAGLSHILALSGMHLSFFSSVFGFGSRRLFGKKYSFWARLLAMVFFVWFAGLSPSLFRALVCSLVVLVCSAVYCVDTDYLSVLSFVFLFHLCLIPQDAQSPAFVLSYGALAGILVLSDFVSCRIFSRFLPPMVSSSISASVSAQAATSFYCARLFGKIMPIGCISSVIVSPMINVLMLVSFVAVIFSLVFPFLSGPFGCILNMIYFFIEKVVGLFALVPPLSIGN